MKHKFTFNRVDEELLEISLDGKMLGSYDHDTHGWGGMEAAERLLTRIAKMLDIEIEHVEGEVDEDES